MNKYEKHFFLNLCSPIPSSINKDLLKYCTPEVLGQLFQNRLHGIGYYKLCEQNLLNETNMYFANSLKNGYSQNLIINENYFACIKYLYNILNDTSYNYVFMPESYLWSAYPEGCRIENTVQILIPFDKTPYIDELLIRNGFDNINNPKMSITEFQHKKLIYFKKIDLPSIKYLKLEIVCTFQNCINSSYIISNMLNSSILYGIKNINIKIPNSLDEFIILCKIIYDSITDLTLIKRNEDMPFDRFCDICYMLKNYSADDLNHIFNRAKKFNLEKICSYVIIHTAGLFNISNIKALEIAFENLNDHSFLDLIVSKHNKKYLYTEKRIASRFFSKNRKSLLKEV